MTVTDPKTDLREYLQKARDALVWKLDGLSEYDIRRPLVPTGTNLLGLIKHLAGGEFVYFGTTFGRPSADELAWSEDDPMSDMVAYPGESRADIIELYKKAWAHADVTFDTLALDARGRVPHWSPATNEITLHQIMLHVLVDTHRHAGHADIVRELIDGSAGMSEGNLNLPGADVSWESHWKRVEDAARQAGQP
jgi:Protein of unknown function (DUF664)